MRRITLLVAIIILAASAARAEPVTLTQVGQPAQYRIGGRSPDILGIEPGMSPDTVRDILTRIYGNATVTQDDISLDNRGAIAESQNFTTRIAALKDGDQITVWFATPTTGNGVVEVSRELSFRDETAAPTMKQERAELVDKFGKPGFDGAAVGTGEVQLMAWAFHGDKAVPCPRSSCRGQLSEGLDPRNLPIYARAVKAGNDLTIIATLLSGIADPSRATGIVVVLSDAATKARTVGAALSQLRAVPTRKGNKTAE